MTAGPKPAEFKLAELKLAEPEPNPVVRAKPLGLPRAARLRKRPEFLEVQSRGRRVHTPHFILMLLPGPRQALGVTVTRKVAGAVGRNRVKRLWREVFRQNRVLFPPGCAVVAVARSGSAALDYAAVVGEVARASAALYRAAGLLPSAARPSSEPATEGSSSSARTHAGPSQPKPREKSRTR